MGFFGWMTKQQMRDAGFSNVDKVVQTDIENTTTTNKETK
jgi:hypothetical protein